MAEMKANTEKQDIRIRDLLLGLSVLFSLAGLYHRFGNPEVFGAWEPTVKELARYGYYGVFLFGVLPFLWQHHRTMIRGVSRFIKGLLRGIWIVLAQGARNLRERAKSNPVPPPSPEATKKSGLLDALKPNPMPAMHGSLGLELPPFSYLPVHVPQKKKATYTHEAESRLLTEALLDLNLLKEEEAPLRVEEIVQGPNTRSVTFHLPKGVRLSQIQRAQEDISNRLGIQEGLQIGSGHLPSTVTILIPNEEREPVYLSSLIASPAFHSYARKAQLPMILGVNERNEPMFIDLAKLRHILLAGTTGSGKSVLINSTITTWLYTKTPEELQLILIDPKRVELNEFRGFPHVMEVLTEPRQAVVVLRRIVHEMDRRYEKMQKIGVKNIAQYQRYVKRNGGEPMPYLVCLIDELADLMMTAKDDVEDSIIRIAQLGRACGIHTFLATQRPSTDVITGLIKANMPSRISLRLNASSDYVTVFGTGSEGVTLLGNGDGLAVVEGHFKKIRFQSPAISLVEEEVDETLHKLKTFWAQHHPEIAPLPEPETVRDSEADEIEETDPAVDEEEETPLDEEALLDRIRRYVVYNPDFTTKDLQELLSIRKQTVLHLLQKLVDEGMLTPPPDGQPRKKYRLTWDEEKRKEFMDQHPLTV